jgi:hypothetical protein
VIAPEEPEAFTLHVRFEHVTVKAAVGAALRDTAWL